MILSRKQQINGFLYTVQHIIQSSHITFFQYHSPNSAFNILENNLQEMVFLHYETCSNAFLFLFIILKSATIERRSVPPSGYITHTISAPSLHGKTVRHLFHNYTLF